MSASRRRVAAATWGRRQCRHSTRRLLSRDGDLRAGWRFPFSLFLFAVFFSFSTALWFPSLSDSVPPPLRRALCQPPSHPSPVSICDNLWLVRLLFLPFPAGVCLTPACRGGVVGQASVPSLVAQVAESRRGSARRVAVSLSLHVFFSLLLCGFLAFQSLCSCLNSLFCHFAVLRVNHRSQFFSVTISDRDQFAISDREVRKLKLAIIDASFLLAFPIANVCLTPASRRGNVGQAASAVARRADC